MIARTWRGSVPAGKGLEYLKIVGQTGSRDSRKTRGNQGFLAMQRRAGDHDEILTLSLWESEAAIRAFAGDDISRAVFYPEDDAWLTDRDLHADHWEVFDEPRDEAHNGGHPAATDVLRGSSE